MKTEENEMKEALEYVRHLAESIIDEIAVIIEGGEKNETND